MFPFFVEEFKDVSVFGLSCFCGKGSSSIDCRHFLVILTEIQMYVCGE